MSQDETTPGEADEQPAAGPDAHPPYPPPSGTVLEAASHTPMGGVLVRWMSGSAGDGHDGDAAPLELGRGVSGPDGGFTVVPEGSVDAVEARCRLAVNPDRTSHVLAGDDDRSAVAAPYDGHEVVVTIAARAALRAEHWEAVADFMEANRMTQAWQLAAQLAAPGADSPVAAWPAARRAGAIAAVHTSLAHESPDGALDLMQMDHYIDLGSLRRGETETAVNVFRRYDLFERFGSHIVGQIDLDLGWRPIPDWLPRIRDDRELYRDYLRATWVTAAKVMHAYAAPLGSTSAPTTQDLETQLDTRFHQNFRTSDNTARPVHQLLVPILRDIVTAPTSGGGFGHATVPPQGDQSDAEYVAALIELSGESATELRNRFRVDVDRPEGTTTSPVELNIDALLGLLADTWQSPQEPFDTVLRGAPTGKPLLFPPHLGRAPFFLQFEEWRDRQKTFHPENVYEIRTNLPQYRQDFRDYVKAQATSTRAVFNPNNDYFLGNADWRASATWVERIFAVVDTVREALAAADRQNYATALEKLDSALTLTRAATSAREARWLRATFVWFDHNGVVNDVADRRVALDSRAQRKPKTSPELATFETWFHPPRTPRVPQYQNAPDATDNDLQQKALARVRTVTVHHLQYLEHVLLPYLRATVHVSQGDLPTALRLLSRLSGYEVGIAEGADAAGYRDVSGQANQPVFHDGVSLPYTTAVRIDPQSGRHVDNPPVSPVPALPEFELRFFRIAQGEVALTLADQLYRNDDPSSVRRARELFKGVVFMHGDEPGISPRFTWSPTQLDPFVPGGLLQRNPAVASQLARAHLGLAQIERGLNAYGYHPDMVPVLRYAPLKQAADLFATSAKSAQTDYLSYMTRFEQAQIDAWQATALVKKGEAGVGIAKERIEIAKAGVAKMQQQVDQVKAQIAAKRKEIEDADDFFSQAKDFFGGMKDSLSGMVPLAQKVAGDDSAATSVSGEQLAGIVTKGFGGTTAAKDAAVSTLGSGMGLAIGFGAFAYAGIMSMQGLEAAAAKRAGELAALETVALPAAQAQVKLAQRDVTIGELQQTIADTELDYARTLARFQQERFLSVELWNKLAAFANRLMRRYVDLSARTAWLAERALEYEQHRDLNIVRLDYLPHQLRGVTGADRLLMDLSELAAERLQGIRLRVPVKHTFSLARDFPMQFGQLKKTGRCAVQTDEDVVRAAYPGMYEFRARVVTVSAQDAEGAPPRGVMRNLGVSTVSREDGSADLLVRFPDALALSEFRLQDDLFVYGLPGETLLQFEGSGVSTLWEIEFPLAANPRGLRSLTDVLVTFDMNAGFSHDLARQVPAPGTTEVRRSVLLASSVWDPGGLATLQATTGPVRLSFPLARLALPAQEIHRAIRNVVLIAVGSTQQSYSATLSADSPAGAPIAFTIDDGVAMSNAGSLLGTAAPLPLNALDGAPLDQTLTVEIDRTGVAEELRRLHDVVLLVEYSAMI